MEDETFAKQIELMVDNLEKLPRLGDINLVFEGGSLNGYYLIGVAMFLKELERRGAMRVSKVSGTSIGAYIAFHYLNDTLTAAYSHSLYAKQSFIERLNLSYFKDAVSVDTSGVSLSKFNNRLFVTYYEDLSRVVQSKYADVSDLCDALCSSAYLPILMDGGITYKNTGRMDGGLPFVFSGNNERTLYVKLSGWNKIGSMFNHRGEKNGRGRVCEGIVSSYNFFLYGSDMCSWVDDWTLAEHFLYKLKHFVCLAIVFIVSLVGAFGKWFIKNNPGYDAIVGNILHKSDLSILMALWQQMIDVMKDMLVLLVV
jgi:hypothetical protein